MSPGIIAWMAFMLLPQEPAKENPWVARAPELVERAREQRTLEAYRTALDAAWRADDWRVGAQLADESQSLGKELNGLRLRALWRAGRFQQAQQAALSITSESTDLTELATAGLVAHARGEWARGDQLLDRLSRLAPSTAGLQSVLADARLAHRDPAGAAQWLARIERSARPENGYPENYLAESISGTGTFFASIGPEPFNVVERHGQVTMQKLMVVGLPFCIALINGKGPYRLLVDTGGSITLSLDREIAEAIDLRSTATATVHGISGSQESGQALVDSLELGEIRMRRVLTRTFDLPAGVNHLVDGILGTGCFDSCRITLDFQHGRLVASEPAAEPAAGTPCPLWIVADSKLLAEIVFEGVPALALLDSGADVVAASPTALREHFPDQEITTVRGGVGVGDGSSPGVGLASAYTFEVGGRRFEKYSGMALETIDDLLSPALGTRIDLLIGMPVFRETATITVEFPSRRLWVEWLSGRGAGG